MGHIVEFPVTLVGELLDLCSELWLSLALAFAEILEVNLQTRDISLFGALFLSFSLSVSLK